MIIYWLFRSMNHKIKFIWKIFSRFYRYMQNKNAHIEDQLWSSTVDRHSISWQECLEGLSCGIFLWNWFRKPKIKVSLWFEFYWSSTSKSSKVPVFKLRDKNAIGIMYHQYPQCTVSIGLLNRCSSHSFQEQDAYHIWLRHHHVHHIVLKFELEASVVLQPKNISSHLPMFCNLLYILHAETDLTTLFVHKVSLFLPAISCFTLTVLFILLLYST